MDRANFLEDMLDMLEEHRIRYCVIGGQGVHSYADPLTSDKLFHSPPQLLPSRVL